MDNSLTDFRVLGSKPDGLDSSDTIDSRWIISISNSLLSKFSQTALLCFGIHTDRVIEVPKRIKWTKTFQSRPKADQKIILVANLFTKEWQTQVMADAKVK